MTLPIKVPPHLKQKPGPKGTVKGTLKESTAKRMQKFNGFPVVAPAPKDSIGFFADVQFIINQQLARTKQKSVTSNLDITEMKILMEISKLKLLIDGNNEEPTEELTDETVKQALTVLQEIGDNNGKSGQDIKTPKSK